MTPPADKLVQCDVIGGEQLSPDAGGAEALCNSIEAAAAEATPAQRFSVEIKIKGNSSMVAQLTTADGVELPEQNMEASDRGFSRGSLERFAKHLVNEVAKAEAEQ